MATTDEALRNDLSTLIQDHSMGYAADVTLALAEHLESCAEQLASFRERDMDDVVAANAEAAALVRRAAAILAKVSA